MTTQNSGSAAVPKETLPGEQRVVFVLRSTRAQVTDALSSQATMPGYRAALLGAPQERSLCDVQHPGSQQS